MHLSDPCADWKDIMVSAGFGGLYGLSAGLNFGTGLFVNSMLGAAIGAAGDINGQIAGGVKPSQIDPNSVAVGALSGGTAGFFNGIFGRPGIKGAVATVEAVLFSGAIASSTEVPIRGLMAGPNCGCPKKGDL